MIQRLSDLSADGLGPMEHTVAEYPAVRGSSPRAGWRRLGCAFTASTASALAILW